MRFSSTLFGSLLCVAAGVQAQVAAGGGVQASEPPASQYPISQTAGSLITIGTSVTATWKLYVQTFATGALSTWELGPTPQAGTIGLGTIQGTVGGVHKRAEQTPAPMIRGMTQES